ncbi:MAG: hypothetical protein ACRC0V_11000 [Fusobacteriaceae bacterium]
MVRRFLKLVLLCSIIIPALFLVLKFGNYLVWVLIGLTALLFIDWKKDSKD